MILTYDTANDSSIFDPDSYLVLDNINRSIMPLKERTDISVVYLMNEENIDIPKANENSLIKYGSSDKLIAQKGIRDRIIKNREYYRNINEGRPLFPLKNMDLKIFNNNE